MGAEAMPIGNEPRYILSRYCVLRAPRCRLGVQGSEET